MSEPKQQISPKQDPPSRKQGLRLWGILLLLWRRLENIAFALVVLLIALYFILQSAMVQSWLTTKAANYLSSELQTTVTVGHVDISFFDKILLEQVYIADRQGDTLLFAGRLSAGTRTNFFSALSNNLEFDEIILSNARVNLIRRDGDYNYNYQFLTDYFSSSTPSNPNKKKTPFKIKVRNLQLNDVVFIRDNEVRGETMAFHVPQAFAKINNFDAPSKTADIESIEITGFFFDFEEHLQKPMPPKPVTVAVQTPVNKGPRTPFQFQVHHFSLNGGRFEMDRFRRSPQVHDKPGVIDYDHLAVRNIGFIADNIEFTDDFVFSGKLVDFTATEQSGFTIKHAAAAQVVVDSNLTALYGVNVNFNNSLINDTLMLHYNEYADFLNFNNKVNFEARLKPGSVVQLGDLAYFSAPLRRNSFFEKNNNLQVNLSGLIKGKVNRLDGRNLIARIGTTTYIDFDFDGEDLAKGNSIMRLEFDFRRLQTDIASLRKIIPGFDPPSNFERLGSVRYNGTYNLFFGSNHILKGDVKTSIGDGDIDIKLDLTEGKSKAAYSGTLNMRDFDLGAWSGSRDLGLTTFNITIKPGSTGLTRSTVQAGVAGRIESLVYKDYNYHSVNLDGLLSEALFEGKASIDDPNIRFNFDGTVNMDKTVPEYKFTANLARLDLKKLHLSDQDLVISARVDDVLLTGKKFADLAGIARVNNIHITQKTGDKTFEHHLDSLRFESNFTGNDFRHFAIRSDLLTATIDGKFNLEKIPGNLLKLLSRQFPEFAGQLHLKTPDSLEVTDVYRYGVYIHDTGDFTKLIDLQLDTITEASMGGQVNGPNHITEMYATLPTLRYGNTELHKAVVNWRSEEDNATLVVSLPDTRLSPKLQLAPIRFTGKLKKDKIKFSLQTKDPEAIVQSVDFNGIISVVDSLWQISFNASKFNLFNESWAIEEDNYLRIGNQYIETKNFELMNGLRRIWLDSLNNGRGLKLTSSNFDLSFINEIIPTRGLTYSGIISDFDIIVGDIFNLQDCQIFLATDTVFINGAPYGRIDGNLDLKNMDAPLEWQIVSRDNDFNLTTSGAWLFGGKQTQKSVYVPKPLKAGDLYSKIEGFNFPMNILQQFVPGISKTEGRFNIDAVLDGNMKGSDRRIGLDGTALLRQGSFVIDYLNTPFYIENQKVVLTDQLIWTTNDTIYDATRRNAAIVNGGLRHDMFRKWQVDCVVNSLTDNFVLLDTKKANNSQYYGKGVGGFTAKFGGTFARTDIAISATTSAGTYLYIPLTSESEASGDAFINFKPKNDSTTLVVQKVERKRFQIGDLKGLNIDMKIRMTEQAEVQLIFDEKAGDILSGRGEGDISMIINREGDFKMYGNYEIKRGEYLFTLANLVNKPFSVANGGTVSWYGDPYGAQIDLDATYTETASLSNLLSEELAIASSVSSNLVNEANKATPVNVNMHLYGDLFKPSISFSLDFPNVSPQLKTYTENKLRLLSQDPNETNRQVFGLVVLGSFLPPDNFAAQAAGQAFFVGTLTQFMSSQLSGYLTGLASEIFGSTVSSIDFNFVYKDYTTGTLSASDLGASIDRGLQFRISSGFNNDRITFQLGSEFGLSRGGSEGLVGEDFVVEIQPLANRQWRIKAYQRLEPDLGNSVPRNRYGIGLSFTRDFNNFPELMKGVSNWFKDKKSDQ